MNQPPITILAPEFKPNLGGVAEYSYQLAQELHALGLLNRVITPVPQVEKLVFKVEAPHDFAWSTALKQNHLLLSKISSLGYLSQLRWIEYSNLLSWIRQRSQTLLIISWIVSPLAEKWLALIHRFKLRYGIILHGKDIITSTRVRNDFFIKACQQAEILIFNSETTQLLFQELQPTVKTHQYVLIPGINLNYLQSFKEVSTEIIANKVGTNLNHKTVISSVARLVKRKGIDLAIQAIAPILRDNPDLVYIIAGDGEEYDYLISLVESLELGHQIKLIGRCSEQEKFSLLQASSIFVMPNHRQNGDDFEGFGISFIEASYFQNVVIGGRSGGAVEAIKEGTTGFLIDTDSDHAVDDLRAQLTNLIQHPEQVENIKKSGQSYVCKHFETTKLIQAFARHLHHVVL